MIPKKEMDKKLEEIREKYGLENEQEVLFLSSLGAGEEGSIIHWLNLSGFNNISSPTGVMERCIVPTPFGMVESGKPICAGHCHYTDEGREKMEKKLKPYEIPLLGRILDKFFPKEKIPEKTIENGVLHCMDEKGEKLGFLNERDTPKGSEEVEKNGYCGEDCGLLDIGEGENVYMIKPDELLKNIKEKYENSGINPEEISEELKNFMSEYSQPIGEEPQKDPMYS